MHTRRDTKIHTQICILAIKSHERVTDTHTLRLVSAREVLGDRQPSKHAHHTRTQHNDMFAQRPLIHVHSGQKCGHTQAHTSVAEVPGEISLGAGQRDVVYPQVQLVQRLLVHTALHGTLGKGRRIQPCSVQSQTQGRSSISPLSLPRASRPVSASLTQRLPSQLGEAILFSETMTTILDSREQRLLGVVVRPRYLLSGLWI